MINDIFYFPSIEKFETLTIQKYTRNVFYQQGREIVILIIRGREKIIVIHGGREKVIWAGGHIKVNGAGGWGRGKVIK